MNIAKEKLNEKVNNDKVTFLLRLYFIPNKEGNKKRIPIIIDDGSDDQKTSQEASFSAKKSVPSPSPHVDVDITLTKVIIDHMISNTVHLSQVTPYEFMQKWNSVPQSAGSGPHAALLKQILPQQLPMCKNFSGCSCDVVSSLPHPPSVVKQTGRQHVARHFIGFEGPFSNRRSVIIYKQL